MLKNSGFSRLEVDLSFLFSKVRVSYCSQNSSYERKYAVEFKSGEERAKIAEDCFAEKKKKKKKGSFNLPFEIVFYLLKSLQKILDLIWTKFRLVLGLLF